MAFGQAEYDTNILFLKGHVYPPIFMLAMMPPMALCMAIFSYFKLKAANFRESNIVFESIIIVLSSVVSLGLVEYGDKALLHNISAYDPLLMAGMIGQMMLIMGLVSYFSLRVMRRRMIQAMERMERKAAQWPDSAGAKTKRARRESSIARRLRKNAMRRAVGVVIMSVCSFGMVEYFANIVLGLNRSYNPILMIGMIGPMGLLMSLIAYVSGRATSHYTVRLIEGIEKVAQGEFDARLDEEAPELYQEVFANFNKMCEELQGVQTLREDFINHFSHEFKTPITSINGFAKVLLEEDVSDEERMQYLEIIASESERLAELSTNALIVTKLESEQYVVDKAPYALDEQIKQCAIILSPQWMKKKIDVSADLEPITFNGNPDLMKQVWINLLGNAIKFTPEHGKISVNLKVTRGVAAVAVADNGKGMTKEELSRAFEKYFQGDPSRSSKGLGLGLAIAKKIVDLCGGRIEAQSVLGEGSVFTVYLPVRD